MLRPDYSKWGQTLKDLQQLSINAAHPRSRERFQALYMIGAGQTNATRWAQVIDRDDQTVMEWVHLYNDKGPEVLHYRRTGGYPPFLARQKRET